MSYDVVLLDLDHTLLDTERAFEISFEATMLSIGISHPASVRPLFDDINNGLWHQVERGTMNPDELHHIRFQQLVDTLGLDADPTEAAACFADSQIESATLYPGARDLVEQACDNARTALVTNGISLIQRGVLGVLGLADTFDGVVISSEVRANKPHSRFFDAAFSALGLTDRSSAVIVGDSLTSDIQGGINAGIDTIWFNRHNTEPGLVCPTHTARSLPEVAELLGRRSPGAHHIRSPGFIVK